MAYAAFAKVDPRLLAEKEFTDHSAAITAAGKAVGDTLQGLGDLELAKSDWDKEEKARIQQENDNEFLQWQRDEAVMQSYLDFQERKELGYGADPGTWTPPPGYTSDGRRIINDTEGSNIVNGIKGTNSSSSETSDGVTVENENNEVVVDGDSGNDGGNDGNDIYYGEGGLDSSLSGQYGPNYRYRNRDEAIAAIDGIDAANGNLDNLKTGVGNITGLPNYDAEANPRITSLTTALENDGVRSVYNHSTNQVDYVWQDSDGKWYNMPASAVSQDGQVNTTLLNKGEKVKSKLNRVDVLDGLLVSKSPGGTAVQRLRMDVPLTDAELQQAQDSVTTELRVQFKKDPDALASFIRTNNVVDPTPDDGEITAEDAANWFWGTLEGDETMRAFNSTTDSGAFNAGRTLDGYYDTVENAYEIQDERFFQELGLKGARFVDGVLMYEQSDPQTDGTVKTKLVPWDNTQLNVHSLSRSLILKNHGSSAERTALLGLHGKNTVAINEAIEVQRVEN